MRGGLPQGLTNPDEPPYEGQKEGMNPHKSFRAQEVLQATGIRD